MASPAQYTDQGTLLLEPVRAPLDSMPAWTQGEPDATVRRPRVTAPPSHWTFFGTIALAVLAVGVFGGAVLRMMDEPTPARAAAQATMQAQAPMALAAPPPPAIIALPPPAVVTYEIEDLPPAPPPKAQPKRAKPKAR